jgi:hypothetical protein
MKRVWMGAMILVLAMVTVALADEGRCVDRLPSLRDRFDQLESGLTAVQQQVTSLSLPQPVVNEYSTTQINQYCEVKKEHTPVIAEAEIIFIRYGSWIQGYAVPGYDTANGRDQYRFGVRIDLPEVFPVLWIKKPVQ